MKYYLLIIIGVLLSTNEAQAIYSIAADTNTIVNMLRPYKTETIFNANCMINSGNTDIDGIVSEVIEINTLETIQSFQPNEMNGKIVFINLIVDSILAYDRALIQYKKIDDVDALIVNATNMVAQKGAMAVVVRTCFDIDTYSFEAFFENNVVPIPALMIRSEDANLLSYYLQTELVQLYIKCNPK